MLPLGGAIPFRVNAVKNSHTRSLCLRLGGGVVETQKPLVAGRYAQRVAIFEFFIYSSF